MPLLADAQKRQQITGDELAIEAGIVDGVKNGDPDVVGHFSRRQHSRCRWGRWSKGEDEDERQGLSEPIAVGGMKGTGRGSGVRKSEVGAYC
jgi:hypothetical protein